MIKRAAKHPLTIIILLIGISGGVVGYFAMQPVSSSDPSLVNASKFASKAVVMMALDNYHQYFGDKAYAPTPLDSCEFSYADLRHPYFEQIRNDRRLSKFYKGKDGRTDFFEAVSMAEYLRDLFPHGYSSKSYANENLLSMLDAADEGEKYLCGDISKMLAEMIQAGGAQARKISLGDSEDRGHVVVEIWSEEFNKWAVIDPDYNVYYTSAYGVPLSAIELFDAAIDPEKTDSVKVIRGKSPNTLYDENTDLLSQFYKNGFAIEFYNKWVEFHYPRWYPGISPSIMAYYVGKSPLRRFYYKHDSDNITENTISTLYSPPDAVPCN